MLKTVKTMAAVVSICAVGVCGTMFAYLTDADTGGSRTYTVGKVDGSLSGAPAENLTIVPNQVISASPKVTVESDSEDAVVFIEFANPQDTLVVCDSGGQKGAAALQDVFTVGGLNTTDWICLSGVTGKTAGSKVYGYKTKVSKGNETNALFNNLTFVNTTEAESNTTYTVTLDASLIQADNLGVTTGGTMTEETLKTIYSKFTTQNPVQNS